MRPNPRLTAFQLIFGIVVSYCLTRLEKPENIHLLQKAFSLDEWQYLSRNSTFQSILASKGETLGDYEELVQVGSLLLKQRDDALGTDKLVE